MRHEERIRKKPVPAHTWIWYLFNNLRRAERYARPCLPPSWFYWLTALLRLSHTHQPKCQKTSSHQPEHASTVVRAPQKHGRLMNTHKLESCLRDYWVNDKPRTQEDHDKEPSEAQPKSKNAGKCTEMEPAAGHINIRDFRRLFSVAFWHMTIAQKKCSGYLSLV